MYSAQELRCSPASSVRFDSFRFLNNVDDNYGVEENGFTADEDNEGGIIIPDANFVLIDEYVLQLQQEIDLLAESQNHGIELYEAIVYFITQIIGTKSLTLCTVNDNTYLVK